MYSPKGENKDKLKKVSKFQFQMNFGKICWNICFWLTLTFNKAIQSEEIGLDWLKEAYVMTMFAINSQAYREISIKAENIWKAK